MLFRHGPSSTVRSCPGKASRDRLLQRPPGDDVEHHGGDQIYDGQGGQVPCQSIRARSGHLAELAGGHLVDEATHAILVGHKRACREAADRLAHVLGGVGECLQGKRGPKARVGLDRRLYLVVAEGQHAAVGVG